MATTASASNLPTAQIESSGSATGYQPLSFDAMAFNSARSIPASIEANSSGDSTANAGSGSIDEVPGLNQHNIAANPSIPTGAMQPLPNFPPSMSNGASGFSNSPLSASLGTLHVPGNGQQPSLHQQGPAFRANTPSLPQQVRPYNMIFGLPGMNSEPRGLYDDHMALPPFPHNGGSWLRIRQPIDLVTPLKKPMNSFLLYSAERRVQLRQTHPDLNTTQQSTILAREWANLQEEEKEKYRAEAKQLRDDYNARRAELSLKLQQQLNQQHLNLGLAPPPPPVQMQLPSAQSPHGSAPAHMQQLELLDSGVASRDHLSHVHSAGQFSFQHHFPGPMSQMPQTQFSPSTISNPHAQQVSGGVFQQPQQDNLHLQPQATPGGLSDPFRLDGSLTALNHVVSSSPSTTAPGFYNGSMHMGENLGHMYAMDKGYGTPRSQDHDVQAGATDRRIYELDMGNQNSISMSNTAQNSSHSVDFQQNYPQASKSFHQTPQDGDPNQMSGDIFNAATGFFDGTFDSVMKPGGTGAGFGALSNTEFKGIHPTCSYTDIVDFAASLPTMSCGSVAEYKYESGTSTDKERGSDCVNMARSFSFNHDQPASSALANSNGSNANTNNNNNSSVRAGSVAKARARLSSPAKRARKKSKKDPDAPKHPMSAFLYYLTSERPRLAEHLGDMSIGQQTKIIAKRWKTLDETDKAPWERLAQHDKDRYARERREYHGETRQSATPAAPH
ncbi:hypothetical protein EV179_004621 [Coemansia sp. RSA 487]|nr:hypothetical protein LPJ74_005310 [Coemansia sp. RSA 1843]KAJ2085957.1 hypothetical protein IW138_006010 [Coemansia sp. RSA 986]KAJ2212505.1 hypothetical protein EV179_004621 [Coemansia sp. RSA 487]